MTSGIGSRSASPNDVTFNLFKFYIWVITKINFTTEFPKVSDFRRNVINRSLGEDDVELVVNKYKYRYKNYIIFILNVILSVVLTVKVFLFSIVNTRSSSYVPYRQVAMSPEADGTSLSQIVEDSLCFDYFGIFHDKKLVNAIVLTLLLPPTTARLMTLKRVFWNSQKMHNYSTIDLAQINLSYLNSLVSTGKNWYYFITSSYWHKHPLASFREERKIVERFSLSLVGQQRMKSANLGADNCENSDVFSKLYFYNMISFDSCYKSMFIHTDKFLFDYTHRPSRPVESKAKADDSDEVQIANAPEQVELFNLDCDPQLVEELGDANYVPEPLHRVDLGEMGWLCGAVFVLYFNCIVLWGSLLISYISLHLTSYGNYSNSYPANSSMITTSDGFAPEKTQHMGLIRMALDLTQVVMLHYSISMGIFDLFNFYSNCVICYSRAKYVRLHLERTCGLCIRIIQSFQAAGLPLVGRSQAGGARVKEGETFSALSTRHKFGQANKRSLYFDSVFVDRINKRIRVHLELVSVIQQELYETKKFFACYLNLEMLFRGVCMVFSVLALLESRNLHETIVILIEAAAAIMPILFVTLTAALLENEFRLICRRLGWLLHNGRAVIGDENQRNIIRQSEFLATKSNRSFVVVGNFSLTLGSLLSVAAWVSTGVVILRQ